MTLLAAAVGVPDYVMIVGYFVIMLGIGFYFYRFMRGMKAYFTGNNRIPWWLSGVSFYMTSFSAFAFVSYSDLAYKYGWVGVTMLWVAVPATIFSVTFFAVPWRRARIDSPLEYLESRYSPGLRQIFVWQGIPMTLIDDALKMIATGKILSAGVGIPVRDSIIWSAVIMLSYTFMGGLWAVMVTDFVQFVVLAAAVLVVLPLALHKVGGVTAFVENSPEGFFELTGGGRGWGSIALVIVLYCVAFSSIRWSLIQRYYCVPREKDARKVGWMVACLCFIGPPLMFIPAMAARQFLTDVPPEVGVYSTLCATLLPMGMLGLLIAAMFSATMSTLSGDLNVCASVLTNDVYRRLVRPNASERELVTVGRIMTLLAGAFSVSIAVYAAQATGEQLFDYMLTLFSIAGPPIGIPMMLGLVSRRFTNRSAVLGLVAGIVPGLALFFTYDQIAAALGLSWKLDNVLFATTSLLTLVTMVVVSRLWPLVGAERERVESFAQRLQTPIGQLPEDEPPAPAGQAVMSPFRIVGICTGLIGLLMLAIQPWITDRVATMLNVGIALALIAFGAIMYLASRGAKPQAAPAGAAPPAETKH